MGADLGSLFDQGDGNLTPFAFCELLQPNRGAETRRPATDDHDVVFHGFAFDSVGHAHFPRRGSIDPDDVLSEGAATVVKSSFSQDPNRFSHALKRRH